MPFERILVAIDRSEGSNRAFVKALELTRLTGAELVAVAVEGRLPVHAATIGRVEEVQREKDSVFRTLAAHTADEADAAGLGPEAEGHPCHAADLIVRNAAAGEADLIVVGHRSRFLGDCLSGSAADLVAHHAPRPVMIVE